MTTYHKPEYFKASNPHYTSLYFCIEAAQYKNPEDVDSVIIRIHDIHDHTITLVYLNPYRGCNDATYTVPQQLRDFFSIYHPVQISRLEFLLQTGRSF